MYQTRHSFASNMLSNKEDIFWVSKMLGHKNLNITLEKYSKYIKSNITKKQSLWIQKTMFLYKINTVVLLDIDSMEIHK
ncbi:tyrosine-type recombinase/integrase [Aliarcobacter cryaerophilus]|nr:tyrosine-type recombinase/integrase [Aliarcobacter cryaerophilus]MCT7531986.1 tyrosine-type recombinase/integrase [Aliarcobacter cryaerophilus]